MLSGVMLASFLMLLLFLLALVLFCLSPLAFVVWLWLSSWGLCPPGVLVTIKKIRSNSASIMRDDYPAFFEDMRERSGSHGHLAPGPSASSCLYAGPRLLGFLLCFHSLYAVLRLSFLPL